MYKAWGPFSRFSFLSQNSSRTSKGPQPPDKAHCPCPFLLHLAFLPAQWLEMPIASLVGPQKSKQEGGALRREKGQQRAEAWAVVLIQSWFAVMKYQGGGCQLERGKGLLSFMDSQKVWSLVSHGRKKKKGRVALCR